MLRSLVGSEMCIRDRSTQSTGNYRYVPMADFEVGEVESGTGKAEQETNETVDKNQQQQEMIKKNQEQNVENAKTADPDLEQTGEHVDTTNANTEESKAHTAQGKHHDDKCKCCCVVQ
eukprot:TRINITY_DN676_c0_g1_i7.p1 TRINITY_DN676_c0_g1~~TRINITY_DN676_c0_g1_i7.p1  ORF type:complete len:118 (-),score=44.98 TRINITY_DN676_c0_g1_i7:414-767(-)